jgi:hypothetical protein
MQFLAGHEGRCERIPKQTHTHTHTHIYIYIYTERKSDYKYHLNDNSFIGATLRRDEWSVATEIDIYMHVHIYIS